MHKFEKTVADFGQRHGLWDGSKKVVLAVSGGADSVALMLVTRRLIDSGGLNAQAVVGHVNHNLRGCQSDADRHFVTELGARLGFEVLTRSVDVKGFAERNSLSIETAARLLRIESLTDIARSSGAYIIATGHHRDDNAETVVHRLLRGTGFRGLCGIRYRQAFKEGIEFIRPLLCVNRRQITEYCTAGGIDWRLDHTNNQYIYTRNRIRLILLPLLQKTCTGNLVDMLDSLSQLSVKLYEKIEAQAQLVWQQAAQESAPGTVLMNKCMLAGQFPLVQAELIRRAIELLGCGQRAISEYHYRRILDLAAGPAGRTLQLAGGFCVTAQRETVVFCSADSLSSAKPPQDGFARIPVDGIVEFAGCRVETKMLRAGSCDIETFRRQKTRFIEWFDMDRLSFPLIVRRRKDGDRFQPLGLDSQKKVGKFLTAERLEHKARADVVIIADAEKIIWLAPVRTAEQTKITAATERVLQIKIAQAETAIL